MEGLQTKQRWAFITMSVDMSFIKHRLMEKATFKINSITMFLLRYIFFSYF